MNRLKLGKKPAAPRHTDFKMAKYLDATILPPVPSSFGFDQEYPKTGWGMLGNDEFGDCAWASAAHETMLWEHAAGNTVKFTTQNVLHDYANCTGFSPTISGSDNGTDMHDELNYRRNTGIIDSMGKRHKIGAYLSLDPGSLTHVYAALYLFETVALGIQFPESAMTQYNAGQMWSVFKDSKIEGGHAICLVGKRKHLEVVTWGTLQQMSVPFFQTYCDEAYAIVSEDSLGYAGLSARGFDIATLNKDLAAL